jgi:hypothetical protein
MLFLYTVRLGLISKNVTKALNNSGYVQLSGALSTIISCKRNGHNSDVVGPTADLDVVESRKSLVREGN